jgi:hypothetical protein
LGLRPHLAPLLIRTFAEGHGQRSFPAIIMVSQRRGHHKLEGPSDSILRSPTLALQTLPTEQLLSLHDMNLGNDSLDLRYSIRSILSGVS